MFADLVKGKLSPDIGLTYLTQVLGSLVEEQFLLEYASFVSDEVVSFDDLIAYDDVDYWLESGIPVSDLLKKGSSEQVRYLLENHPPKTQQELNECLFMAVLCSCGPDVIFYYVAAGADINALYHTDTGEVPLSAFVNDDDMNTRNYMKILGFELVKSVFDSEDLLW